MIPWKKTFESNVKYRGDILTKETSSYRINLVSGIASDPTPVSEDWYPNLDYYQQHFQPTPSQYRDVMNMRWS